MITQIKVKLQLGQCCKAIETEKMTDVKNDHKFNIKEKNNYSWNEVRQVRTCAKEI